jgi:hypothetical protein
MEHSPENLAVSLIAHHKGAASFFNCRAGMATGEERPNGF